MNDVARYRILKNVRVLLTVGIITLALLLVTSVVTWYAGRGLSRRYLASEFNAAGATLIRVQQLWQDQRLNSLAAFLPPADPAARRAWAQRIHAHFGFDLLVQLREGSQRETFSFGVPESAAAGAVSEGSSVKRDTLGAMLLIRSQYGWNGGKAASFARVGPLGDSLTWTVYFRGDDIWKAFFIELANPASEFSQLLGRIVQLSPDLPDAANYSGHPRLQAFVGGVSVFHSPDLDPRLPSQTIEEPGLRLELFASPEMLLNAEMMGGTAPHWGRWGLLVLLTVILALNYRSIRWLTAPTE